MTGFPVDAHRDGPGGPAPAPRRALEDVRHLAGQGQFQLACITAFLEADALQARMPREMLGHLGAAVGMCRALDRVLLDIDAAAGGADRARVDTAAHGTLAKALGALARDPAASATFRSRARGA